MKPVRYGRHISFAAIAGSFRGPDITTSSNRLRRPRRRTCFGLSAFRMLSTRPMRCLAIVVKVGRVRPAHPRDELRTAASRTHSAFLGKPSGDVASHARSAAACVGRAEGGTQSTATATPRAGRLQRCTGPVRISIVWHWTRSGPMLRCDAASEGSLWVLDSATVRAPGPAGDSRMASGGTRAGCRRGGSASGRLVARSVAVNPACRSCAGHVACRVWHHRGHRRHAAAGTDVGLLAALGKGHLAGQRRGGRHGIGIRPVKSWCPITHCRTWPS